MTHYGADLCLFIGEDHARIFNVYQPWVDECTKCRMCGTVTALICKLEDIGKAARHAVRGAAGKRRTSVKASAIGKCSAHSSPTLKSKKTTETVRRKISRETLAFRRKKENRVKALLSDGDAGREEMQRFVPLERVELLYTLTKMYGVPETWLGE